MSQRKMALALCLVCVCVCVCVCIEGTRSADRVHRPGTSNDKQNDQNSRSESIIAMILPQVHLRKPCYDFSFL